MAKKYAEERVGKPQTSKTFTPGAMDEDSRDEANGNKLTKDEVEKLKQALQNATTMQEMQRLQTALAQQKMPKDLR